ncbi:hypothetical protein N9L18_00375 [Candidatus Pacebacteria bacterium]|nr:hypothetical protein [Candidatus Paceibacterota bacterium]
MKEGAPKINTEKAEPDEESAEELSLNAKVNLVNSWSEIIVERNVPENIEDMTDEDLKEWLSQSLMEGTEDFIEQENIQVSGELAERISQEEDVDKRSELELEYLREVQRTVQNYAQGFMSRGEPTKWNSWPKLMKETKSFNCAGAALIGAYYLEQAGVRSMVGNPVGHVVNVIELSNGKTIYADLVHGEDTIHEVTKEDVVISNTRVLKVDNKNVEYATVPVFGLEDFPSIILGNMASIEKAPEKDSESPENRERAKNYRDQNSQYFERSNFEEVDKILYIEVNNVFHSQEMKDEEDLVALINAPGKVFQQYSGALPRDEYVALLAETKREKNLIADVIESGEVDVLSGLSEKTREAFTLVINSINKVKEANPEHLERAVGSIAGKVRSL